DDAPVLLVGPGEEPGHVHEGDQGDVEGVARAHEAAALSGGVDVEHAGQDLGLVAYDAHDVAVQAAEAAHQASGPVGRVLEELAVVEHGGDHPAHVVGLVRAGGHELDQ